MPGLLADHDVEGHLQLLLRRLQSDPWSELWDGLGFRIETFETLGLATNISDATLWQCCQNNDLVLMTANRNEDSPDSLEATIRTRSKIDSLPVITLADPQRIMHDRQYAELVVERLIDYLFEIDNYRGVGRLFVP